MIVNEVRSIIQRQGGIRAILRKNSLPRIIDRMLTLLYEETILKFYNPNNSEFCFVDGILCPKDIYWWKRHTEVAKYIRNYEYNSILDVGGGERGISPFLNLKGIHFCIYDIVPPSKKRGGITYVKGDSCQLPFKTKSFDVVTSIATLPQIPKELRPKFPRRVIKVGKRVILCSEAITDREGCFKGLEWEIKFHKDVLKREHLEGYDAEQMDKRCVELDEIMEGLDPDYIEGCHNFDITYKYMQLSYRPVVGFFAGLLYYFVYKKKDRMAPYKSVIAVVESDPKGRKRLGLPQEKTLKKRLHLSGDSLQP